jgi:hypothetical protein
VKDYCSDVKRRVIEPSVIDIELLPGQFDIDTEMVLRSKSASCNSFKSVCSKVVIVVKRLNLMQ